MESLDEDKYNNTLFTKTRKPLRGAKYRDYRKTSHVKESYYKLYLELRYKHIEEDTSSFLNILYLSYSKSSA